MKRKRHKHEWKICSLAKSDFECAICHKLGRQAKRWNNKHMRYDLPIVVVGRK